MKRLAHSHIFGFVVLGLSFLALTYAMLHKPYHSHNLHYDAPDDSGRELPLRLLIPKQGNAPFPLVMINHGSPSTIEGREDLNDLRFTVLADWFIARGYAVAMPLRRGYGKNGGAWDENIGTCTQEDYTRAGMETAKDILAAHHALKHRTDITTDQTIVIGQSAGGWGVLALASINPPDIAAVINFAGGRGGNIEGAFLNNCHAVNLLFATKDFGQGTKIPSLWMYAENDNFFPPQLADAMFKVYKNDVASLIITPAIPDDGHLLSIDKSAQDYWTEHVSKFLDAIHIN